MSTPQQRPPRRSTNNRRRAAHAGRLPFQAVAAPIGICLAVVLSIVGLGKVLNPGSPPITKAEALPPSQNATVVPVVKKPDAPSSTPVEPSSSAASEAPAQNTGDVVFRPSNQKPTTIPDYSEDAFVISYLNFSESVAPHPMVEKLQKANPNAVQTPASSGAGSSTSANTGTGAGSTPPAGGMPKQPSTGTSGMANVANWKQTVNSDTAGWIKVPGSIDIGVVQGPNTNYYTNLEYNKTNSGGDPGVVWASSYCNLSGGSSSLSKNTVLFGHRWEYAVPRGHFAPIMNFKDINYARSHPYIYFSTGSEDMVWQVFAAFYTDISFDYVNSNGGQYIVDGAIARSENIYDVSVSGSDKLLTLSTCTRHWGPSDRQRWVVMAKLVSDTSAGTPTITPNPNPVRPNL